MHWLRKILVQIYGLFVDDGAYAIAILAWLSLFRAVLIVIGANAFAGPFLFSGLAGILLASTVRHARRDR
jgi:hypothetical protein